MAKYGYKIYKIKQKAVFGKNGHILLQKWPKNRLKCISKIKKVIFGYNSHKILQN